MTQFEDKFMEVQVGMISLAMEYVQNQAEKVYIYAIADSLYSFKPFYKINGVVIEMEKVNEVATKKVDDSDNMSFTLLKYGTEDVMKLVDVCQEYNREHPTEMWLIYDAQKNTLNSRYSYEGRYDKDEELLPRLEFEKWFEEVKGEQLQEKKICPIKINQLSIPFQLINEVINIDTIFDINTAIKNVDIEQWTKKYRNDIFELSITFYAIMKAKIVRLGQKGEA